MQCIQSVSRSQAVLCYVSNRLRPSYLHFIKGFKTDRWKPHAGRATGWCHACCSFWKPSLKPSKQMQNRWADIQHRGTCLCLAGTASEGEGRGSGSHAWQHRPAPADLGWPQPVTPPNIPAGSDSMLTASVSSPRGSGQPIFPPFSSILLHLIQVNL